MNSDNTKKRSRFFWGTWPEISDYPFRSTPELASLVGLNTGNLVYSYAIKNQLDMLPKNAAINSNEVVNIITCANQLGPHTNMKNEAEQIHKLNEPIVAIGLGAQSYNDDIPKLTEGTKDWLEAIATHAPNTNKPNISLRGELTARTLEQYGYKNQGMALGCPSLLINPNQNLGASIKSNYKGGKRIAVLASHSWHKNLYDIERALVKMVEKNHGAYIVQSDEPMMQLARGEGSKLPAEIFDNYRDFLFPEKNKDEALLWWREYGYIFFNVETWLEFYKKFDFAIGARIHGIILAIQAGIPAICIAHDSRTKELCQIMHIPYLLPENIDPDELSRTINETILNFSYDKFDYNRKSLASEYINFLENNQIIINQKFKQSFTQPLSHITTDFSIDPVHIDSLTPGSTYIIRTYHNTFVNCEPPILSHSKKINNPLLFIIINHDTAILLPSKLLLEQDTSYQPWQITNRSDSFLIHVVKYTTLTNNSIHLIHPFKRNFICAEPCNVDAIGKFGWRIIAKEWEEFSLILYENNKFSKLINNLLNLYQNMKNNQLSSLNYKPFELDLILQILNFSNIKLSHTNTNKDYLIKLASQFNKNRLLTTVAATYDNQTNNFIGSDMDFIVEMAENLPISSPIIINQLLRANSVPSKKLCICACARNEGIYLLDFISYYKSLDIDGIFIYSNDNYDQSDRLLKLLDSKQIIKYIPGSVHNTSAQNKFYSHAFSINRDILKYEWTFIIDIDEFININYNLYSSFKDFLGFHENLNSTQIFLNWITVGSNSQITYKNKFYPLRFPKHDEYCQPLGKRLVKTKYAFTSTPHLPRVNPRFHIIRHHANGQIDSSNSHKSDPWRDHYSDILDYNHAALLHYNHKSFDEFIIKYGRPSGCDKNRDFITYSRLTPNIMQSFIKKFMPGNKDISLLGPKYLEKAALFRASLLADPEINSCEQQVQEEYQNLLHTYKTEFIKHIDGHSELAKITSDFLSIHAPDWLSN